MKEEPIHADHRVQRRYPAEVRFCALCGSRVRLRVVLPDRKPFKACPACGFVLFPGPKLVAGCLVVADRKVLLLRRGIEPARGRWTFPGGYVDLGEHPAEAAARETLEEVGLEVRLGKLLGVYSDPANPVAVVITYLARSVSGKPRPSEEATELSYFAPGEIPWHDLAFATTRQALGDWAEVSGKKE